MECSKYLLQTVSLVMIEVFSKSSSLSTPSGTIKSFMGVTGAFGTDLEGVFIFVKNFSNSSTSLSDSAGGFGENFFGRFGESKTIGMGFGMPSFFCRRLFLTESVTILSNSSELDILKMKIIQISLVECILGIKWNVCRQKLRAKILEQFVELEEIELLLFYNK